MPRRRLAEKLISARSETERRRLLRENKSQADVKLAHILKEICYEFWTTKPVKAQKAAQALKSLLKINRDEEIEALSFWVAGISELTKGNLESSIENLESASKIFQKIRLEHFAAQTQVAKFFPLALLGRYEEAVEDGKKTLKIFEKYGDALAAGKTEMNIGNIALRRGFYGEAEAFFLAARKRFVRLGDKIWLTMCENNLAIVYSGLNDFRKAEDFYARALTRARDEKMIVTEAEIEASMGNLALFRGKPGEALRFLELSRQKYEELKMPHQTAVAELEIADIYLELNLAKEAFEIYERVAGKLKKQKLRAEEARARANFGRAAFRLGELKTAKTELKRSAQLYLAEKNKVGAAIIKLFEAEIDLAGKNFKNVLKLAEEAEKLLENSENMRHRSSVKWLKGEAFCHLKKFSAAKDLFEMAFAEAVKLEQLNLAQISLNSLGNLALQTGETKKAEKYFKKAVKFIETMRAPIPAEEFRMNFLADKLAPFKNLAKIYLAEDRLEEAFFAIESARARALTENLGEDPGLFEETRSTGKLLKKLTVVREELNWFYSRLQKTGEENFADLQKEAMTREKIIARLMRQIESVKTGKKSGGENASFDLKRLQKMLGEKKTLIEYVNFDGKLSAFVVTNKKIHFISELATENEIVSLLEGLRFQFGVFRYGAENLTHLADELKTRADSHLQKLYEKLTEPLAAHLGENDLVIVPVGAVSYVPFHALYDGEKYVIETREVFNAPSAGVWQILNKKPSKRSKKALLIGFADEKIPLVYDEIKSIREIFKDAKSFIGEDATFNAYMQNAAKFDILHFACHGQFRAENPLFSSLRLADGFVTVRDICAQKIDAELVTLSACETGLNKIFAGEEILGLARGFLSAGAKSLILSLWTVNDKAAARLMSDFYKGLQRGKPISTSLRLAQIESIKKGSHPYFWAPFALIGS